MARRRFGDPEKFAQHYNVFLDPPAGYGDIKSAGSIGRYKFCDDNNGNPPRLVPKYGILNIKSESGQKFGVLNGQLIKIQ